MAEINPAVWQQFSDIVAPLFLTQWRIGFASLNFYDTYGHLVSVFVSGDANNNVTCIQRKPFIAINYNNERWCLDGDVHLCTSPANWCAIKVQILLITFRMLCGILTFINNMQTEQTRIATLQNTIPARSNTATITTTKLTTKQLTGLGMIHEYEQFLINL